MKCKILHTVYNFTQSVKFYTQCIYFTHNLICEFELPDVSLRCFVVRQLLWCIYALSSVNFQASNCGCVKKVTNMKYVHTGMGGSYHWMRLRKHVDHGSLWDQFEFSTIYIAHTCMMNVEVK